MRECKRCGKSKPLDDFPRCDTCKEGRRWTCSECWSGRRLRQSGKGWKGPATRLPGHVRRSLGW